MLDSPMGFIAVTDFELAKAFYVGVLGLDYISQDGFALVLRSGPLSIRLTVPQPFTPAGYTVFGWRVADIEAEIARLSAKGIAFEHYPFFGEAQAANGVWTAPSGARVAWFKDPSGNVLSLSQHAED
jgi:catechol 2,3-dioxygenase-like lactoylglutathione lyase family enzyme